MRICEPSEADRGKGAAFELGGELASPALALASLEALAMEAGLRVYRLDLAASLPSTCYLVAPGIPM